MEVQLRYDRWGMNLFTSDRERRLWIWTLVVLAAIYASLGFVGKLVMALRDRNLLRISFAALILVLVVAFAVQWIRKRPTWSEFGVAIGVALAYWLAFLRIENPAERTHLLEYGIVAALIHQALLERSSNGRSVVYPAALTVVATALLGLLDESIQAILPDRYFDWIDVGFNAFAGFIVTAARLAQEPVSRPDGKPGWRLWFLWSVVGAFVWGWSMDPTSFGEPRPVVILDSLPIINIPEYASVAAGGAVVGVFQWLMLQRYIGGSIRWLLASLVGIFLAAQVVGRVRVLDADLGLILGVCLYGLMVGVMQWLVLRRQVPRAGLWIPASAVSWIIAIPAGDINGPPGWAVFGAITGTVLVWLLRQERPNAIDTVVDKKRIKISG